MASAYQNGLQRFWIGLSQSFYSTGYGWSDGSPVSFTNWADGQPSSDNTKCVEMISNTG
jgi:hypothetical protein